MVNKCCAYGCKSGYVSHTPSETRITFHSFPADEKMREKLIRANPRKDFVPSKNSRICSLHFRDSDFVEERSDKNTTRRKNSDCSQLKNRYLKKDAVPSVFPNAPSYLTSPGVTRRTSAASAASRQELEGRRLEMLEDSFTADDVIESLTPELIKDRLEAESALPGGFSLAIVDGTLVIYRLTLIDSTVPCVQGSLIVRSDLTVVVRIAGKEVPSTEYKDLLPGSLQTTSQLVNLMARVKAWCEDDQIRPARLLLKAAINSLEDHVDMLDDGSDDHRKFSFILEQLKLTTKSKYRRHYSPQLTVFAYLLHASSAAAHKVLLEQNVICLPSVSTLAKVTRQVSSSNGSSNGLDNTGYLKLRVSKLSELQRNVLLIIDEIYVAKRVEYSAGEIHGLTSDGSVASTLLCFMVKSVAGKYKDLVAMCPVAGGLTAAKLNDCYTDVMETLRQIGLTVVAISVDNAAANRKFFTDFLCHGSLATSITDAVTQQPIYLIFDPVHDLKNVYNNFQSRKVFECPEFGENLPTGCRADFNHIAQVYHFESSAALKKAHKLTPSVLNPRSIEKTSVKLATCVFAESTRDSLRFYSAHDDKPEWIGTADFITVVLKLWNVMNVKSSVKGKHKRDHTMDPVRSPTDWKLSFLREFADFLERWETSGKAGLTRETFLALRETCLALADCAAYLLERRDFKYVLLGQLQSDALESRFGWLRQLSGANYYISVRQVVDSDRKIRAVSLLKFSNISLSDLDTATADNATAAAAASDIDATADVIADVLTLNVEPSASDENIIYYVSGAIARSTVASTKCDHCRESLICSSGQLPAIDVDEELDLPSADFLNSINRGGLVKPTDFVYNLVLHCWRVFEEVRTHADLKSKFLQSAGQRQLFCKVMDPATYTERHMHLVFGSNMCSVGHDLQNHLVRRFFNCVAKNFVRQVTNEANQLFGPPAKKRKIAKLTSCVH